MKEFEKTGKGNSKDIFSELCFCILTANFNAEKSIKIQNEIDDGFLTLPLNDLAKELKRLGHRYPTVRAKYIVEARKHKSFLKQLIQKSQKEQDIREWLVKNVKGIGYKEASHFLRNIGFTDIAIIDFHIIDLLVGYGLIERPKSMTKKKYLEIENLLRKIGKKLNLNLAELDLYLWYVETGKVLK